MEIRLQKVFNDCIAVKVTNNNDRTFHLEHHSNKIYKTRGKIMLYVQSGKLDLGTTDSMTISRYVNKEERDRVFNELTKIIIENKNKIMGKNTTYEIIKFITKNEEVIKFIESKMGV